jgi:hypothetical protein
MVNQAWDSFEEWVTDVVEIAPPVERDARKLVKDSEEKLAIAAEDKKQSDATIILNCGRKVVPQG